MKNNIEIFYFANMQIQYDFLKNKIRSLLLIDELKNSGFDKICIFGAGELGSGLGYEVLTQKFNLSIDYFCDNDPKKWGKHFTNENIICISIEELKAIKDKVICFVINAKYAIEIVKQLKGMEVAHIIPIDVDELKKYYPEKDLTAQLGGGDETYILALGAMLSKQQTLMNSSNINDYEFKIFSQFGDDGIIQYLVRNLDIKNKTFIEFGVEDFLESNTRFLMTNDNWAGFVMDGSEKNMYRLRKQPWFWKYDLRCKAFFIDKDNINDLLKESNFEDVGILSIDLDGNDYYILESIDFSRLNPSVIITEYNAVLGKSKALTVPYDKKFDRIKAHYSNLYWGASLPALNIAAERKGYSFIGCNTAGNNAYFVRNDLLNAKVKKQSIDEGFRDSKFRESRDEFGKLTFISGDERFRLISGLPLIDLG